VHKPTILIVDDLPENIALIKNFFNEQPYHLISANNGKEALEIVQKQEPDLILLDVLMPVMDGFQVCERLKNNDQTRLIPIIMVTGLEDSKSKIKGINLGVDDFISKPFNIYELKARVASLIKLKQYTDQLRNAERILFNLALTLETKAPYRKGHSKRIANYSTFLAERIGLTDTEVRAIRQGSILHDIGKLAIQDEILFKPGPLSPDEFSLVMKTPQIGADMCKPLDAFDDVQPIIRHHRERYDGSGYPDGLKGEEIPLGAQIVALADSFDALTSRRAYRDAMPGVQAIHLIEEETHHGKWNHYLFEEFKGVISSKELPAMLNQQVPELAYAC